MESSFKLQKFNGIGFLAWKHTVLLCLEEQGLCAFVDQGNADPILGDEATEEQQAL
jgi:hypothetical protein